MLCKMKEKRIIGRYDIMFTNITYINPVRMFKSVDFPAPEGPMMAVNSPDLNSPDIDLRMSRVSVKKKNFFLFTSINWNAGIHIIVPKRIFYTKLVTQSIFFC